MDRTIHVLFISGSNGSETVSELSEADGVSVTAELDIPPAEPAIKAGAIDYDCIVSEHSSRRADPVERYRHFERETGERTPPFVVFADVDSGSVTVRALNAGIDGYVPKGPPDGSDRLLHRIRAVVEEREESDVERWRLRRKHDRLETFRSVVSHDLRTPLSAAEGYLDFVRSDSPEDADELLDRVEDSLDRLGAYLAGLNTLEQQGKPVENLERVAVADVAETTWNRIRTGTATLEITANRSVRANRSRLVEAFRNVYENSVVHGTPDSEKRADTAASEGGGVTVTVGDLEDGFYIEDDGTGIDGDGYDDLFEPGFSTVSGATGLGLAIVSEIAAAHRWSVSAAKSPEGGVRVSFTDVALHSKRP